MQAAQWETRELRSCKSHIKYKHLRVVMIQDILNKSCSFPRTDHKLLGLHKVYNTI